MLQRFAMTLAACGLCACGAPGSRPGTDTSSTTANVPVQPALPAPSAPLTPPPLPAPPEGVPLYRVGAGSTLRVLVYRGGPMAQLGHNHVLFDRSFEGWVATGGAAETTSFYIRFRPADFSIDDEDERARAGADFSGNVPADAKAGTARNMLGPALLEATSYPTISLAGTQVTVTPQGYLAQVTIQVHGHDSRLAVPLAVTRTAGGFNVEAHLKLEQRALGLTPFSIALGALQVQDEMTVDLKLSLTPNSRG